MQECRSNYGWWTTIPTRWMDCDAYGHVNNVTYYSYFDTAVTLMLYERGVLGQAAGAIGLCAESACSFHKPITFPSTIDAGVRLARMGEKSIRYELGLFISEDVEPTATGYFVHVFVDRATWRPVPIALGSRAALDDLLIKPNDLTA